MSSVFETARLMIRPWTAQDVDTLFRLISDPKVNEFLPGSHATDIAEANEIMGLILERYELTKGRLGSFAIVERQTGEVIGNLVLKLLPDANLQLTEDIEMGWHLMPRFWGRGFATEVASGCLAYGFEELGLPAIHAVIAPQNERAIRVAHRVGLRSLGQTDRYYGETFEHFALRREEFEHTRA